MKIGPTLPLSLSLIFSCFSLAECADSTSHSNGTIEYGLQKRGRSRFTFFTPGLGACGKHNKSRDPIVALNSKQWDGGAHCYKWVLIKFGHKQVKAQITDECPGCPFGGLDLSPSVFRTLAILDLGVLYGDWHYLNDDSSDSELKVKPTHSYRSSTRKTITSTVTAIDPITDAQAARQTLDIQSIHLTSVPVIGTLTADAAAATVDFGRPDSPFGDDALFPKPNPEETGEAGSLGRGRPFVDPIYEFGDALHLSEPIQARPHHALETALVARPTESVVVPLNHEQFKGNIEKLNIAALNLGSLAGNALFAQIRARTSQ